MEQFFAYQNLLSPPVRRAAYSDRTAWLMAECARLAYYPFEQNREAIIAALKQGGFELCQCFDRGGTQAYLAQRSDLAVLAFRGTQKDLRDIITDLQFRMYSNPDGTRTHTGFGTAFSHIKDEVREAVSKLDSGLPLYITGHSLGGALATIAASQLSSDQIAACYTFGAPRVGNLEFSRIIKVPIYRIVNSTDIVARVPLMVAGYTHVGDLRFLTADGRLLYSPSALLTSPDFIFNYTFNWRSTFINHQILEYAGKLVKIALERNT